MTPLYDYKCDTCKKIFKDVMVDFNSPFVHCQDENCEGMMERQISAIGHYKIKGDNSASVTPKKFRGES